MRNVCFATLGMKCERKIKDIFEVSYCENIWINKGCFSLIILWITAPWIKKFQDWEIHVILCSVSDFIHIGSNELIFGKQSNTSRICYLYRMAHLDVDIIIVTIDLESFPYILGKKL